MSYYNLHQKLSTGKSRMILCRRYYRYDPCNPFDYEVLKARDCELATSFDDDTDVEFDGFK